MTLKAAVAAVKARLDLCTDAAYPSMRVAARTTPCHVYSIAAQAAAIMPATVMHGGKYHWNATLSVQTVADTLDAALTATDDLISRFSGGPYNDTTNGCKLTMIGLESEIGSEIPDDGQQDAERFMNTTITLQITET